jgi:hypothetical protein
MVRHAAFKWLSLSPAEFATCIGQVRESFVEILKLFDLPDHSASAVFKDLEAAADLENPVEER